MKPFPAFVLLLLFLLFSGLLLAQGELRPPAGDPTPTMKSLEELWDQTDGLQNDVDRLDSKVDGIADDVAGFETQMSGLEAQVSALEAQNQSLTSLLLSLGVHLGALPWEITTVDGEGRTGVGASMAMDSAGQPAIAYVDYDESAVKLARRDGATGAWNLSKIFDWPGGDSYFSLSLAFDANGDPILAYVDEAADALKYAHRDPAAGTFRWTAEIVATGPYTGTSCTLAYGPDGPGIAYVDGLGSELKYASINYGAWRTEGVIDDHCWAVSLLFSPEGNPTIAYLNRDTLRVEVVRHDGTDFVTLATAPSGSLSYGVSLAYTPEGEVAVAFEDFDLNALRLLVLDESGVALKTTIDSGTTGFHVGGIVSLRYSALGWPAVAYEFRGGGNIELRYAVFNGSAWQVTTVASGDFSLPRISLGFLPDGQPGIVFADYQILEVNFAERVPFATP